VLSNMAEGVDFVPQIYCRQNWWGTSKNWSVQARIGGYKQASGPFT